MTDRRRSEVVEARADLILSDAASTEMYAVHFETQMHRGTIRRLLSACHVHVARAYPGLSRLDPWQQR